MPRLEALEVTAIGGAAQIEVSASADVGRRTNASFFSARTSA